MNEEVRQNYYFTIKNKKLTLELTDKLTLGECIKKTMDTFNELNASWTLDISKELNYKTVLPPPNPTRTIRKG